MAVNKNFVVKNGLEVNTNLILADANINKVGIGSTAPRFELDVAGGIGATDLYVSGVGTFLNKLNVGTNGSTFTVLGVGGSVGIGTALPRYLLDIRSPVSTGQTSLYVKGDVQITGDLSVDDISLDQASINYLNVTGFATVSKLGVSDLTTSTNLIISGISTFNSYVDVNSNLDISGTLNVGGATTVGGYVDLNNSVDISGTLNVGGATTVGGYVDLNNSVDISSNLNVAGIATIATVDINAGDIEVSNVDTANLNVTGIATIATISVIGAELSNLRVTGVSTLGSVRISSGIVTASTGIVTYYGDGQYLRNVISYTGVGIRSEGVSVGTGVTVIDFRGAGISTVTVSSGIGTIFVEGGGSGTVSISSIAPASPENGDLWYSIDYGRTFVYYDEVTLGIGSTAVWVDAAPFNVGAISLDDLTVSKLTVNTAVNILGVSTFSGITTHTAPIFGTQASFSGVVTATDFNSTSDQSLKTNINTIDNALDIVNDLRGVSFDWKETGKSSYGVIAQELEQVLPALVSNTEIKTVNYNGIIGVLIEAVKELSEEVERLKNDK
jgi:hypothetical protein